MFDLTLAHLTYSDRERDLEARLRDRRILEAIVPENRPVMADAAKAIAASRHQPGTGRIRTVAR